MAIHRSQRVSSSSSSHTPHAWLSDSSTSALMNARKKPATSGSRDQQIERQLHGIALDVRHALGAPAVVDRAREGHRSSAGDRLHDPAHRCVSRRVASASTSVRAA